MSEPARRSKRISLGISFIPSRKSTGADGASKRTSRLSSQKSKSTDVDESKPTTRHSGHNNTDADDTRKSTTRQSRRSSLRKLSIVSRRNPSLEVNLFEVALPLGVGLDELNIVREIRDNGNAAFSGMRLGDRIIYVDGTEARLGMFSVVDALDLSRQRHELVVQRLAVVPEGTSYITVRIRPKNGSLGLGLSDTNVVTELVKGSAAHDDGRLQACMHNAHAAVMWHRATHIPSPDHPHNE